MGVMRREREKREELMEAFLAGWRGRVVYSKQRKVRYDEYDCSMFSEKNAKIRSSSG